MSGLTTTHKKIILIGAGIVLLLCCFFFVFQKNQEKTAKLEVETSKYKKQVERLTALQVKVADLQLDSEEHKTATENFTKEFPCKVPQQNAIFNVYQMMVDTEARVTAIRPSDPQKFIQNGDFVSLETVQAEAAAAADPNAQVEEIPAEADPETQVPIMEMIGKFSKYEVDITGKLSQIMKAIDWIRDNEEHMSVTNLSFTFDSSTANLTGTATINYYELNGNGNAYKEPNVKGIKIGTDSIFGILKK